MQNHDWKQLFFIWIVGIANTFTFAGATCLPQIEKTYISEAEVSQATEFYSYLLNMQGANTNQPIQLARKRTIEYLSYFDTPTLSLKRQGVSVFLVEKLKGAIKQYQIVFEIKDSNGNMKTVNYEAQKYNRIQNTIDAHPLLGKVKRLQRETFINEINKFLITESVLQLKPTIQVKRYSAALDLLYLTQTATQYSYNYYEISSFGNTSFVHEIVLKNYPCVYKKLQQDQLIDDIKTLLMPLELFIQEKKMLSTASTHSNKNDNNLNISSYEYFSRELVQNLPFWEIWVRTPILIQLTQVILLLIFSAMVLSLFIKRYPKKYFSKDG